MAGNHASSRPVHDRLMLAALVAVASCVAVDAWRANAPQPDIATPYANGSFRAAQNLIVDAIDESTRAPRCRWMVSGRWTNQPISRRADLAAASAAQFDCPANWQVLPSAGGPQSLAALEVPFPAPLDIANLPPVSEVALHSPAELLQTVHPQAQWLLAHTKRADLSNPAWRLLSVYSVRSSDLPQLATQVWRLKRRMSTSQAKVQATSAANSHFASPPTLLRGHGPLLTNPNQRLALRAPLPKVQPHVAASSTSGGKLPWNQQVLAGALPYLGLSVDHSLHQPTAVEPTALIQMLQDLALESPALSGCDVDCGTWARESLRVVQSLTADQRSTTSTTHDAIDRLVYLSGEAEQLASQTSDPGLATQLRRARYAMWRRIAMWRAVADIVSPPHQQFTLASAGNSANGGDVTPIAVDSPVPVMELMELVEAHESKPSKKTATQVSYRLAQLATSPDERRRILADTLYVHYRGSNARVAITDDLVNRFLPASQPRTQPVRDRVLGTPVTGQATTLSQPSVQLLPDPAAWRLGLQLDGQARANTVAFERTVKVRTTGVTTFTARQQIVFDGANLHIAQPVARANSNNHFVGASSQYDPLPLVGGIVRSQAAKTFASRRSRAQQEVAAKTARRVEVEMDRTLRSAADRAQQKFVSQIVDPLATGGVTLEPVELKTTPERLVARVRIAHAKGLTAHTPRPRAPSDSLASMQLHETGLSSLASGLELAGERVTAQEFANRLSRIAPYLANREISDDAKQAEIVFANDNPVSFQLQEGKLQVIWNVQELVVRGRANRNFKVHVFYVPTTDGLVAKFDHAAGPYLEGRLRNATRMRLQTIFGKVFREEGQLVFGQQRAGDPRLEGLMLTQLVIDDGWLGIAIGPERTNRTAQLDRYAPLR